MWRVCVTNTYVQMQDGTEVDVPLGDRVTMIHNGFLPKKKSDAGARSKAAGDRRLSQETKTEQRTFKREHKHRPVEMSSKKPVSVLRDAVQGKRRHVRDPRFDSLAGQYNEAAFKKRYSFLYDEALPKERQEIKDNMKKVKSSRKQEMLKRKLSKITQQLKSEEERRKQEARTKKVKEQHKKVAGGKKYYLKKSEQKKQELILKYEELKDSGRLEKYMEKRRKKNAAKDHRYLPSRVQKD